MTDPVVRLADSRLAVQPGGQARTRVTVANPGHVVEGFHLEVLGAAAPWAQVSPPELQVYPHQDATALVVLSPPAGRTTPSGTLPFAVRARSVVDGSRCATEEGDLDVGSVFGLQSRLTPVTSTGRWSAAHAVELTNWGNVAERLRVTAHDPDEQLAFLVHPETVDLPVGASAVVSVRVRARRPTVHGARVRRPFQVVAEPDTTPSGPPPPAGTDPRRAVLDGVLELKPVLSRVTVTGAGLAVLAVGGLAGWAVLGDHTPPASELPLDASVVAPTDVQATLEGPATVTLTWTRPARVDGYELQQVDPATRDEPLPRIVEAVGLPGVLTEHTLSGLEPGTEYCYRLVAIRPGSRSAPSAPAACASIPSAVPPADGGATPEPGATATPGATDTPSPGATEPPSTPTPTGPTPTATGTGSGAAPGEVAGDEWIVVVQISPTSQGDALVRQRAEQLQAAGLDVARLVNKEYPDLLGGELARGERSTLLAVRTRADSQEAAQAFCEAHPEMSSPNGCTLVGQPGRRTGG